MSLILALVRLGISFYNYGKTRSLIMFWLFLLNGIRCKKKNRKSLLSPKEIELNLVLVITYDLLKGKCPATFLNLLFPLFAHFEGSKANISVELLIIIFLNLIRRWIILACLYLLLLLSCLWPLGVITHGWVFESKSLWEEVIYL